MYIMAMENNIAAGIPKATQKAVLALKNRNKSTNTKEENAMSKVVKVLQKLIVIDSPAWATMGTTTADTPKAIPFKTPFWADRIPKPRKTTIQNAGKVKPNHAANAPNHPRLM